MTIFNEKQPRQEKGGGAERRRRHDLWFYFARILAITSWLLFIIALILSYFAAPDDDYGYLRYQNIAIRAFWLNPHTGYLYISLWLSAFFSYLYLIISKYRGRRVDDSKQFDNWLLLLISSAWALYILLHVSFA